MILASASPRRRELMKKISADFKCVVSDVDENITGLPQDVCRLLAERKAQEVAKAYPEEVVIGADTVVAIDGDILGKPTSIEENVEFLKRLSGREHCVFSGYAVTLKGKVISQTMETKVLFNDLSAEDINSYVKTGSGLDKAGGYGIQDGNLVKSILGDYENVVGFSTSKIMELLKELKEGL